MAQAKKTKKDIKEKNIMSIDYKDIDRLNHCLMETKRILPRRIIKTTARQQRKIALAIRRARHLALIEFCDQHK